MSRPYQAAAQGRVSEMGTGMDKRVGSTTSLPGAATNSGVDSGTDRGIQLTSHYICLCSGALEAAASDFWTGLAALYAEAQRHWRQCSVCEGEGFIVEPPLTTHRVYHVCAICDGSGRRWV